MSLDKQFIQELIHNLTLRIYGVILQSLSVGPDPQKEKSPRQVQTRVVADDFAEAEKMRRLINQGRLGGDGEVVERKLQGQER